MAALYDLQERSHIRIDPDTGKQHVVTYPSNGLLALKHSLENIKIGWVYVQVRHATSSSIPQESLLMQLGQWRTAMTTSQTWSNTTGTPGKQACPLSEQLEDVKEVHAEWVSAQKLARRCVSSESMVLQDARL